jgi:hypothetical protein
VIECDVGWLRSSSSSCSKQGESRLTCSWPAAPRGAATFWRAAQEKATRLWLLPPTPHHSYSTFAMSALNDPAPTLATLRSALATLTSTLDPLLASPLSALAQQLESGSSQTQAKHAERVQTKSGEASRAELDGRLDAARLNVSVAYVLLDLVWSEHKGCDGGREAGEQRRARTPRRGSSRPCPCRSASPYACSWRLSVVRSGSGGQREQEGQGRREGGRGGRAARPLQHLSRITSPMASKCGERAAFWTVLLRFACR